jgi:hypothetical protein
MAGETGHHESIADRKDNTHSDNQCLTSEVDCDQHLSYRTLFTIRGNQTDSSFYVTFDTERLSTPPPPKIFAKFITLCGFACLIYSEQQVVTKLYFDRTANMKQIKKGMQTR